MRGRHASIDEDCLRAVKEAYIVPAFEFRVIQLDSGDDHSVLRFNLSTYEFSLISEPASSEAETAGHRNSGPSAEARTWRSIEPSVVVSRDVSYLTRIDVGECITSDDALVDFVRTVDEAELADCLIEVC